jgi:hypothetical protein
METPMVVNFLVFCATMFAETDYKLMPFGMSRRREFWWKHQKSASERVGMVKVCRL